MRFGFCANMIATAGDGTGAEWVETFARLGYDYVELPLAEMSALEDDAFDALAASVSRSGIRCEVCNNFFPPAMRLTGPKVDRPGVMRYVARALARAERLGAERVVFGSGGAKNVPEGYPLAEGYTQVVALLRAVAPLAQKAGITIVIEPLRRQECNLINTFEAGCRLAGDVGEDAVRVLVDYYHLCSEHEPVRHVAEKGERFLRHVHLANPAGRVWPAVDDPTGYRAFFDALRECSYDGRISVEAYADDPAAAGARSLTFLAQAAANTQ